MLGPVPGGIQQSFVCDPTYNRAPGADCGRPGTDIDETFNNRATCASS
jgi:hypothetical protein